MKDDCTSVREWLDAYADGELAARDRKSIEDHLARCPACRGVLARIQALDEGLRRDAAAGDPGPEYFDSLPQAFLERFERKLDAAESGWALAEAPRSRPRGWLRQAANVARGLERLFPPRLVPAVRVAFVVLIVAGAAVVIHEAGTPPLSPYSEAQRLAREKSLAPRAEAPQGGGATQAPAQTGPARNAVPPAERQARRQPSPAPTTSEAKRAPVPPAPAQAQAPSRQAPAQSQPAQGGQEQAAKATPPPAQTQQPFQAPPRPSAQSSAQSAPQAARGVSPGVQRLAGSPAPDPASLVLYFRGIETLLAGAGSAADIEGRIKSRAPGAFRNLGQEKTPPGVPAPQAAPGPILAPAQLLARESDSGLSDATWIESWRAAARANADAALRAASADDCRNALTSYWRMEHRAGRDLFAEITARAGAFAPERQRIEGLLRCASR